jgi:uncharacterized protein YecE (DUF72 family)
VIVSLDVRLFDAAFARPLRPYADRVAVLILEFGAFSRSTFAQPAEFIERLDAFLAALPGGYRYAVEIRNADYLVPDYFATLRRRGVSHLFNAWTRMPELSAQLALPGAFTVEFAVARALLRRGRAYEQAVQLFQPYEQIRDPNPAGREALKRLADRGRRLGHPTFLFVDNRHEGNAPATIEAVVDELP